MSGLYANWRPDPTVNDWHPLKQRKGYKCRRKIEFEVEGEVFTRSCNHCDDCLAMAKRDLAGRAGAEAFLAEEVQVWTLTYKPGEPGADRFITRDRQLFLKRMRNALFSDTCSRLGVPYRFKGCSLAQKKEWEAKIADALPVVRYLGCGERGTTHGRCHWHIVLFLSKRTSVRPSTRRSNGRLAPDRHPWWPHGFCSIDVIGRDAELETKMRAVRYVVKYLDKARGGKRGAAREAVFFRSTSTPLGAAYLISEAKRAAEAGLPLPPTYCIPGLRPSYRPGVRTRLTRHSVRGVVKDHYIRAYVAEWERLRPHVPFPITDWFRANDPDARRGRPGGGNFERSLAEQQKMNARRAAIEHERRETEANRVLLVACPKGNVLALIDVLPEGLRVDLRLPGKPPSVAVVPDADLWVPGACPADFSRVVDAVADRRRQDAAAAAKAREKADAVLRFAKRGPNDRPSWFPGIDPLTGLLRQLSLRGPVPPGAVLRKPISARAP